MSQSQTLPALTPSKPSLNDTLSILVYRPDLEGVHQSGLRKDNFWGRRKIFRRRKRVNVSAIPNGLRETILYAPESAQSDGLTPTTFVRINKDADNDNVVRRGDPFEISFVGMSVSPQDGLASNANELLMYSLTPDLEVTTEGRKSNPEESQTTIPEEEDASTIESLHKDSSAQTVPSLPQPNSLVRSSTSPTGIVPSSRDLVYMHYDPVIEGHDDGNEPDTFVSIPAGKTLYRRFERGAQHACPSVRVRFSIMEIDKVSDVQARAVAGIDQAGSFVSATAVAVPYLELLTRAFAVASSLGNRGLKKYAKPDHVLSSDYKFLIAGKGIENAEFQSSYGDYLQYGYYVFLAKPVEAQLYAQTGSSSQRVPLFLKREDNLKGRERPYFALTGVSYLVMKVSRGCSPDPHALERRNVQEEHRTRLENMTSMSNAIELLALMRSGKKGPIGKGKPV